MKKNRVMRFASMLLILTLLSTSIISGTFAKYITTSQGTDTARVAKWGIQMSGDGTDMFKYEYDSATNPTVKSATKTDGVYDDVVAPGTSGSTTFAITGTPETAYQISFVYDTTTLEDIYLGAGTYTYDNDTTKDGSVYADVMSETVETNYYPIKYKITVTTALGTIGGGKFTSGTAAEFTSLSAALTDLAATTITFDPNEACDATVKVEWQWAFFVDKETDVLDTILGDLAASNTHLTASTDAEYNLNIAYNLDINATQIN